MFFLLQTQPRFDFFAQPDPRENAVILAVMAGFIIVAALGAYISSRRGGAPGGKSYSRILLSREARKVGLESHHIRMVKSIIKNQGIQNPMRMLRDPNFLTHIIRRSLANIDQSNLPDDEKENQKYLIFQIKRIVTMHADSRTTIDSTRKLRMGTELRISVDGKMWYDTTVSANMKDVLALHPPRDPRGREFFWDKGTRLRVIFAPDSSSKLYGFTSRVLGVTRSRQSTAILIAHSDKILQSQKRKYPRREDDRPVFFWQVSVITTGTGRHARKQAVVSAHQRGYGRIEDLSAGGCAIRTTGAFPTGTLIKIQFETPDGTTLSAFGKVRSTERTPSRYGSMHVMFTRVSRKNLNQIQAYVYGITDEEQNAPSVY